MKGPGLVPFRLPSVCQCVFFFFFFAAAKQKLSLPTTHCGIGSFMERQGGGEGVKLLGVWFLDPTDGRAHTR
ncbi:hypothetical protein FN846DRAFT_966181, partial [Sphaerosporella brunnea]